MRTFEIGDAVWYRMGITVREGSVTEVLRDGARIWGYRVLPDVRTVSDEPRGMAIGPSSIYGRPQHREKLIRALMDDADMIGYYVNKLAEEPQETER